MVKKRLLATGGTLLIHSFAHLLMDFMCHYYAFRIIYANYPGNAFELFLLYNFIAFALQCPLGLLSDKCIPELGESFSFGLVMIGWGLGFGGAGYFFLETAGLLLCALGNAFFHTSGSGAVMKSGKWGVTGGGVFISFGALGVGVGDYLGKSGTDVVMPLMFVVVACGTLFFFIGHKKTNKDYHGRFQQKLKKTDLVCLCICLMAVLVRSYGGFLVQGVGVAGTQLWNSWDNGGEFGFWSAMFSSVLGFAGKFAGGFFVLPIYVFFRHRKFNIKIRGANLLWGVTALFAAFWLLVPFGDNPICALAGTFLFHSVMPVTLYEIFSIFPNRPGFAMGLTTLMLFAGMLPAYFGIPEGMAARLILGGSTMFAAVGLYISFLLSKREREAYGRVF